jgi:serine/threonine protein kinase
LLVLFLDLSHARIDGSLGMKLADPLGNGFGLTVLFAQNRGGTPGYWAPEVRAGGTISRAGDVYSYAATLYQLQTGLRPQDGQSLDLTTQGYLCLPTIQEVIGACSQVQPKDRPTMQEVVQMLRGVKWADIQAQRKCAQGILSLAGFAGGLLLLFGLLGD